MLAGIVSALSLVALIRALGLAESHRVARARDGVIGELAQLAAAPPAAKPATTYVGMHGGWLARAEEPLVGVPDGWDAPLREVLLRAVATQAESVFVVPTGAQTLIVAARPTPSGLAWAGYQVEPSAYLAPWRWISYVLLAATALLVATAVAHAISFRKGTRALQSTLLGLAEDLSTPVPHVRARELAAIAEGIGRLADDLSASRFARERLASELAHKERLAALGRVVAGVAHEVRNPLASIKLRLDLVAAGHDLPEAARASVEAAAREIARLDRLVSDLLLVAGKRPAAPRPVDLGALVRARVDDLAPWAAAKGVSVHADGDAEAAVDPESLARALDNVLRNAVEAAPSGTTVEARIGAADGKVEIAVEDRGPGVEPARASELFEPFFTTKASGTGLGLAVSRAIARAHGGDLRYTRADDVTRFSLLLNRAVRAAGPAERGAEP
jgi:signal transduction histidine kinase